MDKISPERHLKNLAFKDCGSKGISKEQEQGGCLGAETFWGPLLSTKKLLLLGVHEIQGLSVVLAEEGGVTLYAASKERGYFGSRVISDIIVWIFPCISPFHFPADAGIQVLGFLTSREVVSRWKAEAAYNARFFQAFVSHYSRLVDAVKLSILEYTGGE